MGHGTSGSAGFGGQSGETPPWMTTITAMNHSGPVHESRMRSRGQPEDATEEAETKEAVRRIRRL